MDNKSLIAISVLVLIISHIGIVTLGSSTINATVRTSIDSLDIESDTSKTYITGEEFIYSFEFSFANGIVSYNVSKYTFEFDIIEEFTIETSKLNFPIIWILEGGYIALYYDTLGGDGVTKNFFIYRGSDLIFSENLYAVLLTRVGYDVFDFFDLSTSVEIGFNEYSNIIYLLLRGSSRIYIFTWQEDHLYLETNILLNHFIFYVSSILQVRDRYYLMGVDDQQATVVYVWDPIEKEADLILSENNLDFAFVPVGDDWFALTASKLLSGSYVLEVSDSSGKNILEIETEAKLEPATIDTTSDEFFGTGIIAALTYVDNIPILPLEITDKLDTATNTTPTALIFTGTGIKTLDTIMMGNLALDGQGSLSYIGRIENNFIYWSNAQKSKLIRVGIDYVLPFNFGTIEIPALAILYIVFAIFNFRIIMRMRRKNIEKSLYPEYEDADLKK